MRITLSYGSVVTAAALGLCLWGMSPGAAADAPKPVTHTVAMDGTSFVPGTLTLKAGDAIVWLNKDPFPHTATSATSQFDSGVVDAGKSCKHTFKTKGEFDYVCTLHRTMKGMVRVE